MNTIKPTKMESSLIDDIKISETEIKKLAKKLTDKQVNEFAEDYGLSTEQARYDLAEYILYCEGRSIN